MLKIHDSVGKALRTANQGHVSANFHALSGPFQTSCFSCAERIRNNR